MFDFGLLSNAALTGLSDTEKENLQKQATSQFLLGSLLSGDPAMGYKAALGVPEQYTSSQKSILEAQQKAAERQSISDFQTKYLPNQFNEASPQFRGPVTPDVEARQDEIATAQAEGRPIFNIQNALQDLIRLPGTAQGPIRETINALQPKVQGNLLMNPNQQIIGGIPSFDAKTGLVSTPNVQGGRVNFDITQAPGFVGATARNTLPPLGTNQEYVYDRNGNPTGIRTATGAIQSIQEIEGAKAVGQAQGQVEREVAPDGSIRFVPRSSLLNQPTGTTPTGAATGTRASAIAQVSPAQATLNAAADERFKTFSNESLAGSNSASGRKLAAEQLYNLSTQIQNNKLTGLQAGAYSFMNAIPGIGKMFEQDITDITRMNQSIATAQLEKTAQQKGAASNLDAQVIARGYATLTDPAAATRMLAAQEIALSDKDIAKNQFVENYTGDPGKISTAWGNSPDNKPIFTHPKFNQFLNEQIGAWTQGGQVGKPVLPAGFQFGTGKKSGQFLIKRPDGSIYTVGQ
jgi:YD repeat-containing protein